MKKDRGNLDVLMSNLLSKIVEFNNASNEANIEIDRLITNGIREAGYDENDQTRTQDISDIKRLTRQNLRNDIYCAEDVRQRAHIFDASMGAEGLSDTTHSTIISLSNTLLPQLMNHAYVKRIISRSFQCIILMIVCPITYLVATIVGKSGLSIGSVIDTYFLRLCINIGIRASRSSGLYHALPLSTWKLFYEISPL